MGQVDLYLAELSRSIDAAELGRRIRTARVAAGMTQAQVAAEDVSAAYLSRIEDGQRRPEAGLLERMAGRMGVSLEDLLLNVPRDRVQELRLAVDYAELSLVSGDGAGALKAVDKVLADEATANVPPVLRAAKQVRALALENVGDLDAAIVLLEDLTAEPTPDASWLKSLIALSRCHRVNDDYARAIAVGEQAQATIEELGIDGLTEAIQLTVTVAGAYLAQDDNNKAMQLCLHALAAAEKYDSSIGKASAYWNASIAEAQRGATDAALELARKALAHFEVGGDNRHLAGLRTQIAHLYLLQDPADAEAALELLSTLEEEMRWSGGTAWEVSATQLLKAKAYFILGDHGRAAEFVDLAMESRPEGEHAHETEGLVLKGRIAFAAGDRETARRLFQAGAQSLTAAGADKSAGQLWFELADLLAEVGDHEAALQAFRSAGASSGLRLPGRSVGELQES